MVFVLVNSPAPTFWLCSKTPANEVVAPVTGWMNDPLSKPLPGEILTDKPMGLGAATRIVFWVVSVTEFTSGDGIFPP